MIWIRRHWLALSVALLSIGGLTPAMLLLQAEPAVAARDDPTQQDVERVLQLARTHDPRRAIPGIVRRVRLSAHEADLLLNQAAARWRPSHWKVTLAPGSLQLQASVALNLGPWQRWLNLELRMRETSALPQVQSARIGRLPLPGPLVTWAMSSMSNDEGARGAALVLAAASVHRVQMHTGQLTLTYAWGPEAASRLLATLLPVDEHVRLRVYANALAQITAALDPAAPLSLSQLLPPLFKLARQRTAEGGDGALENRAVLMVLGMVANGIGLSALLPERAQELDRRPIRVLLAGRRDFPQHFLVSATLAAESGTQSADSIGLMKELADARRGSGFSFNDIAANRAGTRFGELAVQSPDWLQRRLIGGVTERDFMPDVADLPEFMSEPEFRQRFGGPGSPEYERMVADIEQRLTNMALFR